MPLEPGFFLHRSNRTEQLLAALVEVVRAPASDDPLAAECIVVQGQGMERWLSMSLARELGVWARPSFPFLRRLLDDLADRVLESAAGSALYEPDTLLLVIADELLRAGTDPDFAPVVGYVGDDPGGLRRVQLAARVARTFEAYTVHRPGMLEAWSEGASDGPGGVSHRDARWQSKLWRRIAERSPHPSPDRRWRALAARLRASAPPAGALPPRLSIFGLSSLPPIFVDVLDAIASHVPVHVHVLSPTREYWADLRTRKGLWRAAASAGEGLARDEDDVSILEGHPLLASFGRLGRDFQAVLESQVDYRESAVDLFVDPVDDAAAADAPLLHRIQSEMLHLATTPQPGRAPPRADRDDSLRLHVCHTPLREVEVLRDQLVHLFERDPTLEPGDVVVMAPDIERHAPLIEAVFGGAGGREPTGRARIPHRIADRSIVVTREGVAAFLQLLDVASGRAGASEVLDLLALPSVRERYDLSADDVARIDGWVGAAGVRWGFDGAHREAEGLPNDDTHTWRFGLDRLLLGAAMDPVADELWAGRRALPDVEGDDLRLVCVLASFVADLEWAHALLDEPRSLAAWTGVLRDLADRFIVRTEDNAHHHQALRDSLDALRSHAEAAGHEGALGFPAASALLLRSLRASTPAYGFLSGGVTFCEMVPMRSIPFRVVCLIGLDDGAFPRLRRAMGFDLTVVRPMVGDRSPRDDDRALFLEAILSARDKLLLSWVGRDVHDNEERPPSVVVAELFDVTARHLGVVAMHDAPGWVIEHPLKAFSARYFEPDRAPGLFSYDDAALAGAMALTRPPVTPPPFVPAGAHFTADADAASAVAGPETLELGWLARAVRRAARVVLREVLEVRIDAEDEPRRDREPSDLRGLERWQLGDALLARLVAGELAGADVRARFTAEGWLPPGELGRAIYAEVAGEAAELAGLYGPLDGGAPLREVEIDFEVGGVRLVGRIPGVTGSERVRIGFSKLGGPGEVEAWVEHLALCASGVAGARMTTRLIGRAEKPGAQPVAAFAPVPDAAERLAELIEIALRLRSEALPLFAKTSRKYVSTRRKQRGADAAAERQATLDAYEALRGEDEGGPGQRGELHEEPELRFLWRDRDPLRPGDAEPSGDGARFGFRALANRVFRPMLDALEVDT